METGTAAKDRNNETIDTKRFIPGLFLRPERSRPTDGFQPMIRGCNSGRAEASSAGRLPALFILSKLGFALECSRFFGRTGIEIGHALTTGWFRECFWPQGSREDLDDGAQRIFSSFNRQPWHLDSFR